MIKLAEYTYDPGKIIDAGKDQMRFELGDNMVQNGIDTCALADEEIIAILKKYPGEKNWKRAKLKLLESICHRFSYEVDEKIGPLSYGNHDRAKLWKEMYEQLKKEVSRSSVPSGKKRTGPAYFYSGMHRNPSAR